MLTRSASDHGGGARGRVHQGKLAERVPRAEGSHSDRGRERDLLEDVTPPYCNKQATTSNQPINGSSADLESADSFIGRQIERERGEKKVDSFIGGGVWGWLSWSTHRT